MTNITRAQAHTLNPLIHETDPVRSIENCTHLVKFCVELLGNHHGKQLQVFEFLRLADCVFDFEQAYHDNCGAESA